MHTRYVLQVKGTLVGCWHSKSLNKGNRIVYLHHALSICMRLSSRGMDCGQPSELANTSEPSNPKPPGTSVMQFSEA